MRTPSVNFDKDDSLKDAVPNRVLLFLEPGTSRLQEYPGDEEMIRYIDQAIPTQEQKALREGITLCMRCADGIYECTLNTENGDISITPIDPKPKTIQVHFNDDIFPGDEQLLGFLQERLTKSYKIGTHLTLHFLDKTLPYQIGLVPSQVIEGVSNRVTLLIL